MKATINYLFDTTREILTFDNSEFDRPCTILDLRKCENIVIGKRVDGPGSPYEVLIEDGDKTRYIYVSPLKIQHPSGGGTMLILEVN